MKNLTWSHLNDVELVVLVLLPRRTRKDLALELKVNSHLNAPQDPNSNIKFTV